MDAFTMAEDMLHGIELSADQLAQLRAINHEYYTRLFALSRSGTAGDAKGAATRTATPAEMEELHATMAREIREMLTPEQRRARGLEG